MPIKSYPFFSLQEGEPARPYLPIRVYNPLNGKFVRSYGLIDSGADDCAIPAEFAESLGHDLSAVPPQPICGAGGEVLAYPHTTRIDILSINSPVKVVHTIPSTPIDFMVGLPVILLGVNNFLGSFVVTVNYPKQCFSINKP